MDIHRFFKDHYFHEADRRHKLTGAIAVPVGVVTLIGGALSAIVKPINAPFGGTDLFTLFTAALSLLAILTVIYFLVRSHFNYTYEYIATPKDLEEYREKLISFYQSREEPMVDVDSEMEKYINSEYAKCTHRNTQNNDKKSTFLHQANLYVVVALVFGILASGPYVIDLVTNSAETPNGYLEKSIEENEESMADEKKPVVTPPQRVEKPTPPPSRLIKESEMPKEEKETR